MIGPLLFGVLIAIMILGGFLAVWRRANGRDPIEARLAPLWHSREPGTRGR